MITEAELARLRQFFGSTFHQDWNLDATTPEEAIRRYAADNLDGSTARDLIDAIGRFIEDHPDEAQLESALSAELWCAYWPPGAGVSVRDWLRWVADMLATVG